MADQEPVDWPTCDQKGCIGIRVGAGPMCLAHASDEERDAERSTPTTARSTASSRRPSAPMAARFTCSTRPPLVTPTSSWARRWGGVYDTEGDKSLVER